MRIIIIILIMLFCSTGNCADGDGNNSIFKKRDPNNNNPNIYVKAVGGTYRYLLNNKDDWGADPKVVIVRYGEYRRKINWINAVNIIGDGVDSKEAVRELFMLFLTDNVGTPTYGEKVGYTDNTGKFIDTFEDAMAYKLKM